MVPFVELKQWGGTIWKGDDLSGLDAGLSIVKKFLREHPHDGWTLSIFDTLNEENIEIECSVDEMPGIISYVYNVEHACPLTFIGENPVSRSYVVGMPFARGHIKAPGSYRVENGKLQ